MSKNIAVTLADGFEEIEAIAIIDVLRRAELNVVIAGVGKTEIVSANGVRVIADTLVSGLDSDSLDMVILPGGFGGTEILASDAAVQKLLKEMDNKNKNIGAICAAPLALKKAEVLKKSYTCYPGVEELINHEGFRDDLSVVKDSNIITSRGPGTAICFGLAIVKELVGVEKYMQLKNGMLATYCE